MPLEDYRKAIAVVDTSAIMKDLNVLDTLNGWFGRIVIPEVCVGELTGIKDRNRRSGNGNKAWIALQHVSARRGWVVECADVPGGNDARIVSLARTLAERHRCLAYIVTDDIDFSCRYDHVLRIGDIVTRIEHAQAGAAGNPESTRRFAEHYRRDWSGYELPEGVNLDGRLPGGRTILIDTIRSHHPDREAKLDFILENGVDLDATDSEKYFLTPLAHCIQLNDLVSFRKLLDAGADFNKGSLNEASDSHLRVQNEGNTPLMIACWHGRRAFVELLCAQKGICLNQQDRNGYTALIKCAIQGNQELFDYLIERGADRLIRDRKNHTADWWLRHPAR